MNQPQQNYYYPQNQPNPYYPPNQVRQYPAPPVPPVSVVRPPKRTYSSNDSVWAWVCFASSYLFCRTFPVYSNPLGAFLFLIVLFTTVTVMLFIKKSKPNSLSITVGISALVVSLTLFFNSNHFLHTIAYVYSLSSLAYYIYSSTGNSLKKGFNNFLLIDYFKAMFILPFCSLGCIFKAAFSGKAKNSGKIIAKLFLGIAITIIPTAVIFILLSYDNDFYILLCDIFSFDGLNIFSHVISLLLAIPVSMYAFGLYMSSSDNKCKNIITTESCSKASKAIRKAPVITVLAATIPMLFIYVVFFISQWKYYISGFTGVLPPGFSYANYAREGFFQLCTVSVINLIVIILILLFMRRKGENPTLISKVLCITFSMFTIVLMSTAFTKLIMYIDYYGLTQKRVYAAWFMAVLALIFILITVKQFVHKLNLVSISAAVLVIMFAVLALSNTDALIAKYNVDRYLKNSKSVIDIEALAQLNDAAIPEMVRLKDSLEDSTHSSFTTPEYAVYSVVSQYLEKYNHSRFENEDFNIFSYNLPALRAKEALDR